MYAEIDKAYKQMAPNIKLISDSHLEWHKDRGSQFIRELDTAGIDILVVAGDIGFCPETLPLLAAKAPHVVFVLGNHDYYGIVRKTRQDQILSLTRQYPNLHWLEDSAVTLLGQRFIGGTLWFPEHPLNVMYERDFADFKGIQGLRSWVYQANAKTVKYLTKNILPGDVVVTHHAPSEQSIPTKFSGDPCNRFFVCPMDKVIREKNPVLWVHGHTHNSFDYILKGSQTRVQCNPLGYPFELNTGYQP